MTGGFLWRFAEGRAMPKTPIEMMLNGVEWVEMPAVCHSTLHNDMPYTTHSGVLDLFGHKLRCHRLSNGQTVFDAEDFRAMFDHPSSEDK